ncbi:uncharacterized protein LOC101241672 isoform X4 [Hydra vulgaris]|uniref:Uncharacterized protein LOC101241672 isoform X4 n=1 Tax=Hydra vulgaris TaxID=6087 RepID=A0ABM4D8A3_HYDVU
MKRKAKNQPWSSLKKSSEIVRPIPNSTNETSRNLKSDSEDEIFGFSSDSDNERKEKKLLKIVEKVINVDDKIIELKKNQRELNSTTESDILIDEFNEVVSSAEKLDNTIVDEFNESIDEFNEIITSTEKLNKIVVEEFNESIEFNKTISEELIDVLTPSQSTNNEVVSNKTSQNVCKVDESLNESVLFKKKKKVIKGGFAERLQKLVSREKSDLAFWKHDSGKKIDSEQVIYMHVLNNKSVSSVRIIICQLFDSTEVYLVMPEVTASYLKIKSKVTLKITPPWKRIFCKDIGKVVLLCAYKVNILPNYPVSKTKAASDLLIFSNEQLMSNSPHQTYDDYDTYVASKTVSKKSVTHSSINYAIKQKNDFISFTARIQRVFKRVVFKLQYNKHTFVQRLCQQKEEEIFHVLFVQDNNGMYAEIILPSQVFHNIIWKQAVSDGVNGVYKFENLIELNLKTNLKSISVASMLKSMDSLHKFNLNPESHSKNSLPPHLYTFKVNEFSLCNFLGSCDSFEVPYVPYFKVQCPLTFNQDIRGSFMLRLVSITSDSFNQITDDVLKQECYFYGYCEIKQCNILHVVRKFSSCLVPQNLIVDVCLKEPQLKFNMHSVFFTDVFIKDQKLTADMFSTINHTYNNQDKLSKKLELISSMCLSLKKGDLYLVEATILGLNGSNTCDVCFKSNDLTGAINKCMKCHSNIKAHSKMQLSVFLSIPQLAYASILCELLEETTSNLLSNIINQGIEECFSNSLLGKSLGIKLVQVLDIFIGEHGKSLILKEVIQLAS